MKDTIKRLGKKAAILPMILIVMVIFTLMGYGLINLSGIDAIEADKSVRSLQAFWNAEAGVEHVIDLIASDSAYVSPITGSIGGGNFSVTVTKSSDTYTLVSTGTLKDSQRVVSIDAILANSPLFDGAILANGSEGGSSIVVELSGQVYTDSYDSSIGTYDVDGNKGEEGDVMTNADIDISGQSYIYGDVETGSEGVFNDPTAVSGSIEHDFSQELTPVTVPLSLSNLDSGGDLSLSGSVNQTLNPGDYHYSEIQLSGQSTLTVVGPANIYLSDGGLSTSGQSELIISAASTGKVVLYIDDDVAVSGQGILNETSVPSNFILYGSGQDQNIFLSGQEELYAAIYAPNSTTTLSGQSELFGALVCDTAAINGQASVHFDIDLRNFSSEFDKDNLIVQNWLEIFN